MPARLQEHYAKTLREALTKEFSYKNPFEVPKLISNSMSYGSWRRTSAIASTLAGAGPPGAPKSAAAALAANTSAVITHQTFAFIVVPSSNPISGCTARWRRLLP